MESTRTRWAAIAHLALMPILAASFASAVWISGAAPTGDFIGSSTDRAEVDASKPRNVWTTADLSVRFAGCVSLDDATSELAVSHVVKFDAGRPLVVMPRQEVADRLAVFGGTASTADDVSIVGSCYSAAS